MGRFSKIMANFLRSTQRFLSQSTFLSFLPITFYLSSRFYFLGLAFFILLSKIRQDFNIKALSLKMIKKSSISKSLYTKSLYTKSLYTKNQPQAVTTTPL